MIGPALLLQSRSPSNDGRRKPARHIDTIGNRDMIAGDESKIGAHQPDSLLKLSNQCTSACTRAS
jgi:hypothetical protein